MVSKSFLQVGCGCGARSDTIRKDVDQNRGWQRDYTALKCPHFHVKYDAYTKDGGLLWWGDDKIRFEIYGICKQCDCKLSRASSQATGCSTPDHNGTIRCPKCKSTVGWSVRHCAHGFLKTVGWTATAGVLGAITGGLGAAVSAQVLATETTVAAGALAVGGTSALGTLGANIDTKGEAGLRISADTDTIRRVHNSMLPYTPKPNVRSSPKPVARKPIIPERKKKALKKNTDNFTPEEIRCMKNEHSRLYLGRIKVSYMIKDRRQNGEHTGYYNIGFGHVLTQEELNTGIIVIDGVSHEYRKGLSQESCKKLFKQDWTLHDPSKLITNPKVSDTAIGIIHEMVYQMGMEKVKGFEETLKALNKLDYKKTAAEMRDSKWWREDTPTRAEILAKIMESLAEKSK